MSAGSKNHGIYKISHSPAAGQRPVGYVTIATAIAAASNGDIIEVGPGTYAESFTVPSGVTLRGAGPRRTTISGGAVGGTRITLSDDSRIERLEIAAPNDANYGVLYNGTADCTIRDCHFVGTGALGYCIGNTNTGTMQILNCAYISGTAAAFIRLTSGEAFVNVNRIDGGTLTDGILVTGGVLQLGNFIIQAAATVTDGLEIGAASALVSMLSLTATNAIHVTSDSIDFDGTNIFCFGGTWDILVDPGVTGGTFNYDGGELAEAKISAPGGWHTNQEVVLSFSDEVLDDEAYKFWSEINVGHAELGREATFGEGDSYTRGMMVITSDSTATGSTEGGNLTDVSVAARSPTGSTFSFQGTAANHCIYVGSSLEDASDVLKHWGIKVKQTTAAVEVTPRSFVFERWTGAAWTAFGTMATHADLFHRYSNQIFIRTNTKEHIRFGLCGTSTWTKKTISGNNLYWIRIRITSNLTTAPVFEQFKLSTSRSELNADGTLTHHGCSRPIGAVISMVNSGESGGVGPSTIAVGSGGLPTGWNHIGRDTLLNNSGDAVYYQFTLPEGIDTSYPLSLRLSAIQQSGVGTGAATFILSVLPVQKAGVLVADPTGGTTPVARTLANTETVIAKAAQAVTNNTDFIAANPTSNKIQRVDFDDFDITNYYEGDILLIRLELDDNAGGTINAFDLSVAALRWVPGEKIPG